ncbi:alpha-amylase family glycosyl hydrolase [Marinigracilibium pacificum]|uniref:Alpha-amylase n=1 Tax=Marinigracilibium pacificum TaxID=2729599 RepID=A0A848J147_9BACT|nr:alpha-amylase family glycosyl hydrolase [Marinigracilibium pacificum]NMM49536.1 alpha-amylase [Marinigracilibium pacificum]
MKLKLYTLALLLSTLLVQSCNTTKSEVKDTNIENQPFENIPSPEDVVLYQVNIRTFSESGDFKGVIARLDSIKSIGANVIYLMPIYPIGKEKSVNSPYCIQDYLSVNPEFGSLKDLQRLVQKAHNLDMAVILDWVANHTAYDHVWIKNKDWYQQDSTGSIISPPGTGWNDVAQLNFDNEDMTNEMVKSMKYWVKTANIDGFRCDYSDGPPYKFWSRAIDSLRNTTGHELIMLSEGRRNNHFTAGFDYNFGFDFFENLRKIFNEERSAVSIDSFNIANYNGANEHQRMVRYTSNHDINGSEGTPLELFGGVEGSLSAFIITTYMKSVPMIYSGQEVGTPYRLTFPFTEKDIDWSINKDITEKYKQIISVYNQENSIRRGKLTPFSNDEVVAFSKEFENEQVIVFCNVRSENVKIEIPETLNSSDFKNVFTNKPFILNNTLELGPYEYLVIKEIKSI